eukprot:GHVS01036167.1.p2 GENE.GHVS01036167.1~~GHVS01036167.1.p2  ORF type:complete len:161 (-),score=35.89 GHVS01036167.1:193-675(-)
MGKRGRVLWLVCILLVGQFTMPLNAQRTSLASSNSFSSSASFPPPPSSGHPSSSSPPPLVSASPPPLPSFPPPSAPTLSSPSSRLLSSLSPLLSSSTPYPQPRRSLGHRHGVPAPYWWEPKRWEDLDPPLSPESTVGPILISILITILITPIALALFYRG